MQTIKMKVPVPCKVEYTVRHKGKGKNNLRVRFGSFYNLIWANAHDFDIEPGKSKSRTTEEKKDNTGSEDGWQDVRWRLSRKALTKAIRLGIDLHRDTPQGRDRRDKRVQPHCYQPRLIDRRAPQGTTGTVRTTSVPQTIPWVLPETIDVCRSPKSARAGKAYIP